MNVRAQRINEGKMLYYIENKNIKTVIVWVMFYMPHNERASLNALLPRVLARGSKSYKTTLEITKYLYKNYGAAFGFDIGLKGEVYTLGFYTNFVNEKLLPHNKNLFKDMVEFLGEIIYNPQIDGGGFSEEIVKIEKENLIGLIEGKINNKDAYSFDKCIELMCSDEPYGTDKLGRAEWAGNITRAELLERYYEIINNAPLNIYIMGDINFHDALGIVEKSFGGNRAKTFNISNRADGLEGIREFKETTDAEQSRLCLGFRTGSNLYDEDFPSLIVFNKMFGGGPQSKLFMEIREKEGLCYNIFSTIEKYKGLLFAACGIERGMEERARDEIINIFKDLQGGNFSEEELEMHIHSCIKDYEDIKDDNYAYISFLQGLNIYNCSYDLEDLIIRLKQVDKEGVIKCSRRIKLDTIYLLEGR